jgi:hypothetical protein
MVMSSGFNLCCCSWLSVFLVVDNMFGGVADYEVE